MAKANTLPQAEAIVGTEQVIITQDEQTRNASVLDLLAAPGAADAIMVGDRPLSEVLALTRVKPGPSRRVTVDSAGNASEIVSESVFKHPVINALAASIPKGASISLTRVKPGPNRKVTVDAHGFASEIVSSSELRHAALTALKASIPKGASLAAVRVKPGPNRQVVVDANGFAQTIIGKSQVRHPDIDAIRANAAAAAAGAKPRARRRIVSRHGGINPQTTSQSNGVATGGTDRLAFVLNTDCRALEFVLFNSYPTSGFAQNLNGNALQFAATFDVAPQNLTISFPGAQTVKIQQADGTTAAGARTAHVLGDQEMAHSSPVACGILTAGSTQYYRLHKKVAAGEKWPLNHSSARYNWVGGTTSDQVYGTTLKTGADGTAAFASPALGAFAATSFACGFQAVIGEQITEIPVTMVNGDSISDGAADDKTGHGWMVRVLEAASKEWFPCGIGGSDTPSHAKFNSPAAYLAQFVDHVWTNIGTNDLATAGMTLATMQANILAWARNFSCRENKIWVSTILPRTSPYIKAATCGGGTTATITIDGGWLPAVGSTFQTTIAGMSNAGYNGTFTATVTSANTFTYPVASAQLDEVDANPKARTYTTANFLADLAGQLPNASFEGLRVAWNNWLRDTSANGFVAQLSALIGPSRVGGVFDPCLAIEKNADGSALALVNGQQAAGTGGRWPANGVAKYPSDDGIHPKTPIVTIIAPALQAQASISFVI